MNKIIIPQSNTNDEYVFIIEWKMDNNVFVNKDDHVLSIETSKVVEEIYSENAGYLEKLFGINDKVKVGEVVAILNENKKNIKESIKKEIDKTTFTKKAQLLIQEHKIDKSMFKSKQIVKETDVKEYMLKDRESNKINQSFDQLIILKKEGQPYHAALFINNEGIMDLSLLGSKTTLNISDYNFGGCKCDFFKININKKKQVIDFLKEPALLTDKIIKKEKSSKGWYKKAESANFILEFRDKRSKSPDDMNCIEWLVYGLELGGQKIPENILTANLLKKWARENLQEIQYNENLDYFQKYY